MVPKKLNALPCLYNICWKTDVGDSYHFHSVEDVPITVDHDAHWDEEAGQEEEEDEWGVVGVFGGPVQGAAQFVDLQRVAVPPDQRSPGPDERVEPDVSDGPPDPGEVHHLSVHHPDVALIGQSCQSHDGHDAWRDTVWACLY